MTYILIVYCLKTLKYCLNILNLNEFSFLEISLPPRKGTINSSTSD